ncbi:unnamed protein product [Phytophthora lilii]|uniref:Unnamed protein product n=1 Tax=Phytophthora lilii TaxID=2077276 RepID=A0A9W6XGH7_9STRA|nr:unnamed protein product [Phytophthora lilii]
MSSGFSYSQPTFQSSIYNPSFYLSLDWSGYLTYDYAQTLYLSKDDYRMGYLSGGSTYYDLSRFLTSIPTSLSLNNLSTSGDISYSGVINGFLAYGNQTTVGSLTELDINFTPTNEYFSITGSGLDFLDGSYTRMMTLTGSNTTPFNSRSKSIMAIEQPQQTCHGSGISQTTTSDLGSITRRR